MLFLIKGWDGGSIYVLLFEMIKASVLIKETKTKRRHSPLAQKLTEIPARDAMQYPFFSP
jgi:hypothetical protein